MLWTLDGNQKNMWLQKHGQPGQHTVDIHKKKVNRQYDDSCHL